MQTKSKSKIIPIICVLILIGAGCFAGAEFLRLNDNSEKETTIISSSLKSRKETLTVTQKITQSVTEVLTDKTTSTPYETTKAEPQTTVPNTFVTVTPTYTQVTLPSVVAMDYSCFDNSAFLGNSRVLALKTYGFVKNVYGSVGLTVDTVFTETVSGSNIPVIDELNGKNFDKVFILFGDNECGWPNTDVFINHYARVIAAVKERVPEAEIYLQSILPVSRQAEETTKFGCTNDKINIMNSKIKEMAETEGVNYLEPSSALAGPDGKLPEGAASDGIHLNKTYCKIWLNYLVQNIK